MNVRVSSAFSPRSFLFYFLILVVAIPFIASRWLCTLGFWGDSARSWFEVWRFSLGELPYRDFSLQYPPLCLWVFGVPFQLFGATFLTAQVTLAVFFVAILWQTFLFARHYLSEPLAFVATLFVLCGVANNPPGGESLYSLRVYSPSVVVCLFSCLLYLLAIIGYVRSGSLTLSAHIGLGIGAFGSFLGKPEAATAVLLALIGVGLADLRMHFRERPLVDWVKHWGYVSALTLLPSIIAYGVLGAVVGMGNMLAGLTGYGQATIACPFWPTGLSATHLVLALAFNVTLFAYGGLATSKPTSDTVTRYLIVALLGIIMAGLYLVVLPLLEAEQAMSFSLSGLAIRLLDFHTWLEPLKYLALVTLLVWTVRFLRSFRTWAITPDEALVVVLLSAIVGINLRNTFGNHVSPIPYPLVTAFPFQSVFFLLVLVWGGNWVREWIGRQPRTATLPAAIDALRDEKPLSRMASIAGVSLLVLALIMGLRALKMDRRPYTKIETLAGVVYVWPETPSKKVYDYVMANTKPDDRILDFALGGGINFATRRKPTVFQTQFRQYIPEAKFLSDAEAVAKNPPRLAISNDPMESEVMYGVAGVVACTFPRLLWKPVGLGYDPSKTVPSADEIKKNYTVTQRLTGENSTQALLIWENLTPSAPVGGGDIR
jgi:hypothetical protein